MSTPQIVLAAFPLIKKHKWTGLDINQMGPAHIMNQNEEGEWNFMPISSPSYAIKRSLDPRYTEIWKHVNEANQNPKT